MIQATLKKKLMKEGLLDEKGKPTDKTPTDWFTKYKEFTHYGKSVDQTASGSGDATAASSSNVQKTVIEVVSESPGTATVGSPSKSGGEATSDSEKSKKKKKKKDKKSKKQKEDPKTGDSDDDSDDD